MDAKASLSIRPTYKLGLHPSDAKALLRTRPP